MWGLAHCWCPGGLSKPESKLPSCGPSHARGRFCGERSQFVVASQSSRITVRLHSDQSYTDTGFWAEFLSYDSHDREWLSRRRNWLEGGARALCAASPWWHHAFRVQRYCGG